MTKLGKITNKFNYNINNVIFRCRLTHGLCFGEADKHTDRTREQETQLQCKRSFGKAVPETNSRPNGFVTIIRREELKQIICRLR